ncbi:MAG: hypothetical protein JWO60_1638, partial [Frankiales bacterium]|nr:hypothetical protein [Frankiales bacterium]
MPLLRRAARAPERLAAAERVRAVLPEAALGWALPPEPGLSVSPSGGEEVAGAGAGLAEGSAGSWQRAPLPASGRRVRGRHAAVARPAERDDDRPREDRALEDLPREGLPLEGPPLGGPPLGGPPL